MSANNLTPTGKDVIYIDIDDEITTLIDKMRSSHARIVALVLPKRATTLQSIVNMKLLKRAADDAKKHLVLITSEAGLLPLAGDVGVHVAKTLQSKPEIPPSPHAAHHEPVEDSEEAVSLEDEDEHATSKAVNEANLDKLKPVGELAGVKAEEVDHAGKLDDSFELDDEEEPAEVAAANTAGNRRGTEKGKGKKLSIPNFNKFRLLLVLGGAGIVLFIVLLVVALSVLPKATITIKTNDQSLDTNATITLNPSATAVDTTGNVIPAQSQQTQKTLTQQVSTTGQQNNGQKATGSVTFTAQECNIIIPKSAPASVPAGTAITASGLTFITQQTTSFSNKGALDGNGCADFSANNATAITAQTGGTKYNLPSGTNFKVSGRSDVGGSGSTDGGTDSIIQIVAQADIDSATQKLGTVDTSGVKQQLENTLKNDGLLPIPGTFNAGTPSTSTSANVGDQATSVTVTQQITYTMLGVKQSDLQTFIAATLKQRIDPSKQSILDYGISSAIFNVQTQAGGGSATVVMQDTAVVGSQLNIANLKKQVAGKKTADVESIIKANPGVTDVTVKYSPFWVSSVPGKTSKVIIKVEKPTATKG